MPILSTNFANVPDSVPLVGAGEHPFVVDSIEHQDAKGKREAGISVSLKISDGPDKDRRLFDNYSYSQLADEKSMGAVKFRHFLLSIGETPTDQVNTDLLKGKYGVALVNHRTYKDENDGEMKTVANVKDYITPKR